MGQRNQRAKAHLLGLLLLVPSIRAETRSPRSPATVAISVATAPAGSARSRGNGAFPLLSPSALHQPKLTSSQLAGHNILQGCPVAVREVAEGGRGGEHREYMEGSQLTWLAWR